MKRSARKRRRREAEIDALNNERGHRANGNPLISLLSNPCQGKKGATLGKLSQVWPSVNWRSALGPGRLLPA